ncbi:MAG: hypothetical protein WC322_06455 [Candidatus Paceibacterota bacterium]|jgi:hypothetical protein
MWTKDECREAWELLERGLKIHALPTSRGLWVRATAEEFKIAEQTSDAGYHFVHTPSGSHLWVYRRPLVDGAGHHGRGEIYYCAPPNALFGGRFDKD